MANFELLKSETVYDKYMERDREFTMYFASPDDYVEVDSGFAAHKKVSEGIDGKGVKKYPNGAWIVGFGSNINPNGFILHITRASQAFNDRIEAVKYFKKSLKKFKNLAEDKNKKPKDLAYS